eukprot:6471988-Amphidinium_carterae.2
MDFGEVYTACVGAQVKQKPPAPSKSHARDDLHTFVALWSPGCDALLLFWSPGLKALAKLQNLNADPESCV